MGRIKKLKEDIAMMNLRSKLLFLTSIPLIIILLLSIGRIAYDLDTKKKLESTKHRILEAGAISRVVHYMQIERGLSTGYIAKDNLNTKDKPLEQARKDLDRAMNDAKSIHTIRDKFSDILNGVQSRRDSIDLLNMSASEVKKYYTKNISILLDFAKTLPVVIDDREDRNYIQGYTYLASAKESLGQIRATLMEVFVSSTYSDENFVTTKELLKIYGAATNRFRNTLVEFDKFMDFYNKTFNGEAVEDTLRMINVAIEDRNKQSFDVDPLYWFSKSTETINLLKTMEDELFNCVNRSINKKLDATNYTLALIVSFLVIIIGSLAYLMFTIAKGILSSTDKLSSDYSDSLSILEQYKSTVDRSFIVSKTNPSGIITYVNDEFCKTSGYSKDELLGKSHNMVRHPDTPKEIFKDLWHIIKDLKQPWFGEIKNRKKDGSIYWVKAVINPITDARDNVVEYIAIRTDITQQKTIAEYFEKQLMISEKNFDCSMHLSKEYEKAIDMSTILSRTDKEGIITYANDKFLEISGYTFDELVGRTHAIISSEDTNGKIYAEIWDTIKSGVVWHGIIKNKSKIGKDFWTQTSIVPIKDVSENVIEYLAIRYDVTKIMEQRKAFEDIAKTDPLTGCGNRFRLNNDMRELDNLCVSIFNIDNFRQINDFYGHQFGDLIIKSISDKIYSQISQDKNFRFYRLQGDEFIALAIGYTKDALIQKVINILDVIKEKFTIQNEEMLISCSCGISFEDKEHLLSTANMALKIAKKSNTDFLVYSDDISLNRQYENNINWTRKLSHAIKEGNLVAFYQPIVNNSNSAYEKYECLVRIIEGDRVISPFFFLEVSKQTRQYFDITKTVITQSFEKFKDKDVEFSINLSIKDILEPQIFEYIIDMLKQHDIGHKVVFEIVESESIENFDGVINFITEVRKYNCKIAIDDFGTGYSNFEYLIKLKADYLKIDGSLIKNLDKDKNALLVVSTIVEFSKKLGMKTIAEFVENENIFKIVQELGIDYSQGYYFSEPKKEIF